MSYYDTIEEDLARAKQILEEGSAARELEGVTAPAIISLSGGTIYGKDVFATYKLLESFVAHIETHFRPDHNGECLSCDEPEDAHGLADQAENYQLLLALMGVTDYKSAVLAWKRRGNLIDAIGEKVCETALRMKTRHDQEFPPDDK